MIERSSSFTGDPCDLLQKVSVASFEELYGLWLAERIAERERRRPTDFPDFRSSHGVRAVVHSMFSEEA
jgi:hypothetical protein